ncbi:type VI secretion system tip protein VgrG [Pseudomonas sp. N3-W]|uniref:type VI secretion system Vgr family protein n=1 Tax=Pseudomonas sp. N3-W TaxID=2975049 RepID=UPI00217D9CDF|nr:type VI secretion system tip protein TssI/VgrG [Pseudomonas sp. N3-W]UWF47338.1 type VI secretion system tip protein VgrG [Pseudomonas sp. N3-W]
MHNDKESPFTLTLVERDLSLQVLQFSGHEGLNQPYRFTVDAIGLTPPMELERLLQQSAFLSLGDDQGFHGRLHSASREHRGAHRVGYHLVLVPHLQTLEQQRRRRVFHRLSVPDIVRQLLEEHALPESSYRIELTTGHYPVRPFCIQYEESDLALLHRLCEEEGIHYHFEHHHDGHVLVLADDSLGFPQEPVLTPFRGATNRNPGEAGISELFQRHESPATRAPSTSRSRGAPASSDGAANEPHASAGSMIQRPAPEQQHCDQLSRRGLERLRCQHTQIRGQSDQPRLLSATILQVEQHPLPCFNNQWLLTEIQHHGQQTSILEQDPSGVPRSYRNEFSAIAWSTAFRPSLKHARPIVPGYQPARVLGPAGQPATVDDHGRILIALWPTAGAVAEEAGGIWLPVVIGACEGGADRYRLPRAGSDVLINFLDGDPDRPVLFITSGCEPPQPAAARKPRSDTRLLLDWLINRPDLGS